jgi:hypothetical protein
MPSAVARATSASMELPAARKLKGVWQWSSHQEMRGV